jgi:hypothetical protein
VKETRVALKNVSHERNIKIGGGRDASVRVQKEAPVEKLEETDTVEEAEKRSSDDGQPEVTVESRNDKKRDRRRHRRRRLADERREWAEKEKQEQQTTDAVPSDETTNPTDVAETNEDQPIKSSAAMFGTLFPPPPTLISETIAKYKEREGLEGVFFTRASHKEESSQESQEEPIEHVEQVNIPATSPDVEEMKKNLKIKTKFS